MRAPSPSATFAQRLVQERARKRWTAQDLATATERLGMPLTRSTIAKLESGARGSRGVTLDEAIVLALALDVPLTTMTIPVETAGDVALTPEQTVFGWRAYEWMAHGEPLPDRDRASQMDGASRLWAYLNVREAQKAANEAALTVKAAEYEGGESRVTAARRAYVRALKELSRHLSEMEQQGLPTEGLLGDAFKDDMVKLGMREA